MSNMKTLVNANFLSKWYFFGKLFTKSTVKWPNKDRTKTILQINLFYLFIFKIFRVNFGGHCDACQIV